MCAGDMSIEGVEKSQGNVGGKAVTGWGMKHRECINWVSCLYGCRGKKKDCAKMKAIGCSDKVHGSAPARLSGFSIRLTK